MPNFQSERMDLPSLPPHRSMASVADANRVLTFLISATWPLWVGTVVLQAAAPSGPPPATLNAKTVATGPATPVTESSATVQDSAPATNSAPAVKSLFIREYRVLGAKLMSAVEIGDVVYPFLGPGRTVEDVEKARAALEKAYHDKGFQTVAVDIPQDQQGRGGVIFLQVVETKVGRLRVKGSRYFSLDAIRKAAPSIAEGKVPNWNEMTPQILALNQWPDRRITPALKPGVEPGTVDIDLNVQDTFPLHGNIELNNRYSADTSELRLNGGISYGNLWQLGHGAGLSFQVSPESLQDVKVISGYYLARLPNVEWLTLTLSATKQDSNVSTLDSTAVAGKGDTVGLRAGITLPSMTHYVHSLSLGVDYKHYDQDVTLGATAGITPTAANTVSTPITYYPVSAVYSGTWFRDPEKKDTLDYTTTLNAGVYFSVRGTGSADTAFDNSRYLARGNFVYLKGDLSHEHELPKGFQFFAKVQGQISDQPLVSNEQFAAGGLSSARGYLEGEVPGDNAIFGSVELRSPSLLGWISDKPGELRVYGFFDCGYVDINDPLPEQDSHWKLASVGFGSHLRLFDHWNGSLDAGLPLISQTTTVANHWLLTFRVWADF